MSAPVACDISPQIRKKSTHFPAERSIEIEIMRAREDRQDRNGNLRVSLPTKVNRQSNRWNR